MPLSCSTNLPRVPSISFFLIRSPDLSMDHILCQQNLVLIVPSYSCKVKLNNITNLILNKIQLDATVRSPIYFTAKSLYMFRVPNAPIIRSTKPVTAASGTGHNTGTATSPQRCLIRQRWTEVAVPILWPVPEAAVTVFSTPDDGCGRHPKHVEWFCSEINRTAYCLI